MLWEGVGSMLCEDVGSMRVPVHGMGHSDGQGWEIVVAVLGMSILVGSKRHRTRQTRCLTTKCPASQSRIGQENRHFSGRWR